MEAKEFNEIIKAHEHCEDLAETAIAQTENAESETLKTEAQKSEGVTE